MITQAALGIDGRFRSPYSARPHRKNRGHLCKQLSATHIYFYCQLPLVAVVIMMMAKEEVR